jgi:hypothetical protein
MLLSVWWRLEIGVVAWAIGAAVGGASRWSVCVDPSSASQRALLAACFTLLAISGGRFGAAWFEVRNEYAEFQSQVQQAGSMTATDETAMFHLALDWIEQQEALGKKQEWPPGLDADSAGSPSDLPQGVWELTRQRWQELPESEKSRQIAIAQAALQAFSRSEKSGWTFSDLWLVVRKNLDFGDAFFAALAAYTAFRIAASGSDSHQETTK